MQTKQEARSRAEVILQVRAGLITAKAAAALLGVSRKTYYQWEQRGLSAMLRELENQKPGRPAKQAPATETALTAKVAQLESKLKIAEQTAQIRAVLRAMEGAGVKKKRKRSRKSSACSKNSKPPPG